jgi:serine O-acetyltransferase
MVPSGGAGARGDFAHYCRVHGARSVADKLTLPLRQPALFALWVYRYGRWIHFQARRGALRRVHLALYAVLVELSRHITGIMVHWWVELDGEVWIESHHPVIIGARRIGRGTFVHGGATLGAGGRRDARGLPVVGERVVLGPGCVCIGPTVIPDGSVLAPNALVTRTLPVAGRAWVGAPARECEVPAASLVARIGDVS